MGKMLVHEAGEALAVVALQQVHQLVDNDVLQAARRFLYQLEIKPDRPAPMLHEPHFVFICLMPQSATATPIAASQRAMSGAASAFSWRRYTPASALTLGPVAARAHAQRDAAVRKQRHPGRPSPYSPSSK